MKVCSVLSVLLGIHLALSHAAFAKDVKATQANPKATLKILDQKRIHAIYSEGDFERVIAAIDSFTDANKTFGKSDSVFIAKHLAVIYSANPVTREKGKSYMFRLLALLPSAKIVDMFVSDEIDHIFEKVKEEYEVRKESLGEEAPTHLESNQYASNKMTMTGNPEPKQASVPAARMETGSNHTLYWVAGGVALAAVAGSTLYLLQPKPSADRNYVLPK